MLPDKHFLIAGLVIAPVAVVLPEQRSVLGVTQWVLAGGLASVAVDLDVIALVLARSGKEERLKQFRNPVQIQRKFNLFMDTIAETGILKTAMKTHFIISAVLILLSYCFLRPYFLPVTLGVVSHLLSDAPHLRKLNTPR
ncbi:MAG: hypothetical protein WC486_06450 [Candidatus Omnitrophota bacterium]|jgi:hypothetical protein